LYPGYAISRIAAGYCAVQKAHADMAILPKDLLGPGESLAPLFSNITKRWSLACVV
jgi:hypothetical protein